MSCRRARASAARWRELAVKEGDHVNQGQVVATVGDEKLVLQMKSLDAQIAGLEAQLAQTQTDLTRAEDLFANGTIPKHASRRGAHRLQCRHQRASRAHRRALGDRAAAHRRQGAGADRRPRAEGAGDHRHGDSAGRDRSPPSPSRISCCGCACRSAMPTSSRPATRSASTARNSARNGAKFGTIRLVYPQIEDGRVVADATGGGSRRLFRRRAHPRLGLGRRARRASSCRRRSSSPASASTMRACARTTRP